MAKKKTPQHIHKYHRVEAYHKKMWACALPDCTHYMPSHLTAFVIGKRSICWGCDAEILLDEDVMKDDRPKCFKCKHPNLDELLNELVS